MTEELVLIFDFETPLPANDLGEVFVAMARDYHDMTKGRVLVVTRVESGSIVATLTDAVMAAVPHVADGVAVLVAVNALAEFIKNLKGWLGHAKSENERNRLYRGGRKTPGQRSVEAIVNVAARTRSHVRVKHRTAEGETLEAELTPTEAINTAGQQAPEPQVKAVRDARAPRTPLSAGEVQGAIERLQRAGSENLSMTEIQTVVDVVVAVLQAAGAGDLLPDIASELEMRGLFDFANAMRQHISTSGGTHEPPLTTT